MNDLYRNEGRTFQNFFCPTLKLKEKLRVNSKYIKEYPPPPNTLSAIAGIRSLSFRNKNRLTATFYSTSPFVLKKIIQAKLKIIFNALK
jgi:hypothetical protein